MRLRRWHAVMAVISLFAWGSFRPCSAQEVVSADQPEAMTDQEVVMLRGQPLRVWPNDDLRELGFDIPEVDREDNAWWTYLEAINLFKELPDELGEVFSYAQSTAWPGAQGERLKDFLLEPDNQRAFALARQASAMEQIEPTYFGDPQGSIISVLLPNLSAYRQLAKMLVVDGRRLEAQGARDQAVENYLTVMRMGHHVGRGFTLIEGLVGVSCWAIGDLAINEMALRRDLRAEELRDLLEKLADLDEFRPGAARGIQNERHFGLLIVDELASRPFSFVSNMNSIGGAGGSAGPARRMDSWGELEARIGRLVFPDRTIKRQMTVYYDQLVERAEKPAYEARWDEFDEESAVMAIPNWNVLARMLLPSLSRAATLGERLRMQSLATRLVVALRLFANEHDGEAPGRLAELQEYVPADDLIDPFSGKPFVYKQNGPAWMIYSVSEDGVDDGGEQEEGDNFRPDHVRRFPPTKVEPFAPAAEE